ncbi:MAG: phage holin family protein [Candidatus Eremiobacteraeota bacterium]|nr:phage holin family protein [Candidatus Eremiobacteraeota bacterium]MBC5826087.1 phage holin family protein [Candidatus Eremiobacteraeota bacterium]
MRFLLRVIVNAVALLALSYLQFMNIHVNGIEAALIGGAVLGLANAIVRPILVTLSCPLEILSLGLFTLVINGIIFYAVLRLVPGFIVPNYWAAFWGAIAMSVISWIISLLVPERERSVRRVR